MLVLSRKLGQRFQIGQDIRVTIVKIDRNSVRIGIEAPGDVTVYREEIVPAGSQAEIEAAVRQRPALA
jgi:carbon storage regulator